MANIYLSYFRRHLNEFFLVFWPVICVLVFVIGHDEKIRLLYIMLLVYGYSLYPKLPLVVTALIPLILVPLFHIQKSVILASGYFSNTVLSMSAMFNSITLQYSGLHERLVFWIILKLGCTPRKIAFGLMFVSHFLAMFLSNTFTVSIMIPIAMKIFYKTTNRKHTPKNSDEIIWVTIGLDAVVSVKPTKLGIAYVFAIILGSLAGGLNFSRGSPTNSSFMLLYKHRFNCYFNQDYWFLFTLPVSIMMCITSYLWLLIAYLGLCRCKYFYSSEDNKEYNEMIKNKSVIKELYHEIGPVTWHQICVGLVFLFGICLWATRKPFGNHGWHVLLMKHCCIQDTAPSLFISCLMMIIPSDKKFLYSFSKYSSKRPNRDMHGLVTWRILERRVNWSYIIILGCMYSLGVLQIRTGLAKYIAEKFAFMKHLPLTMVIMISTFIVLFITEVFQNYITATALLPVFFELAIVLDFHPMSISCICCLCASIACISPIASRGLRYTSQLFILTFTEYLKVGMVPKILCYIILVIMYLTYGRVLFHDELQPGWIYNASACYCKKCKWDVDLRYLVLRFVYY